VYFLARKGSTVSQVMPAQSNNKVRERFMRNSGYRLTGLSGNSHSAQVLAEGKAPSIIDGTWKPPVVNLDKVKRFAKSGIYV